MKAEIITKLIALERFEKVEKQATDLMESYGKLMTEIDEQPCIDYMKYARLLQLKENECCIFINDEPAEWLTDFQLDETSRVIGIMCFRDINTANIENENLVVLFKDGTKEIYKQDKSGYWYILNPIQNN